jgi:hypothetical protein
LIPIPHGRFILEDSPDELRMSPAGVHFELVKPLGMMVSRAALEALLPVLGALFRQAKQSKCPVEAASYAD